MTNAVDIGQFIDQRKVGLFQLRIVILCGIAMIVDGFDAQSIAFVVPMVAGDWGIPHSAFGLVFSSGLFGLAIGSLAVGALADRFGRKTTIVCCMAFFGVFTLAKVLATSVESLLILQFVAGLGVGGVMPNAIALTSEYSPKRHRVVMVTTVASAFSIGASGAGFLAAEFGSRYGWQLMFYVGGIVPLLLLPAFLFGLPESIRFLMLRQGRHRRLAGAMKKLDPGFSLNSGMRLVSSEKKVPGAPVVHLLTHGRAASTLLLWFAVFMGLSVVKFMTSWLPVLLSDAGFSVAVASAATATYLIGGFVGSPGVGYLMDRFGKNGMLALSFGLGSVLVAVTGLMIAGAPLIVLYVVVFLVGMFVIGGHNGISALAGELYPTYMRSTGIGWALGMGRFGSTLSPMLGTLLLGWHWSHSSIFATIGIPVGLAAVAVLLIEAVMPTAAPVISGGEAQATPELLATST